VRGCARSGLTAARRRHHHAPSFEEFVSGFHLFTTMMGPDEEEPPAAAAPGQARQRGPRAPGPGPLMVTRATRSGDAAWWT
jgi:hypothetical protein